MNQQQFIFSSNIYEKLQTTYIFEFGLDEIKKSLAPAKFFFLKGVVCKSHLDVSHIL